MHLDPADIGRVSIDSWGTKKLFSYALRRWFAGSMQTAALFGRVTYSNTFPKINMAPPKKDGIYQWFPASRWCYDNFRECKGFFPLPPLPSRVQKHSWTNHIPVNAKKTNFWKKAISWIKFSNGWWLSKNPLRMSHLIHPRILPLHPLTLGHQTFHIRHPGVRWWNVRRESGSWG